MSVILESPVIPKIVQPYTTLPSPVFQNQNKMLLLLRVQRYNNIVLSSTLAIQKSIKRDNVFFQGQLKGPRISNQGELLLFPRIKSVSFDELLGKGIRLHFKPMLAIRRERPDLRYGIWVFASFTQRLMASLELDFLVRFGPAALFESFEKLIKICKYRRVFDIELDALTNFLAQKYLLIMQERSIQMPKYMLKMTPLTMQNLRGKAGCAYVVWQVKQELRAATALLRKGVVKVIYDMVVDLVKWIYQSYPSIIQAGASESAEYSDTMRRDEYERSYRQHITNLRNAVLLSSMRSHFIGKFYYIYTWGFRGGGGYPYWALDRRSKERAFANRVPKLFRVYSRKARLRYQESIYLTHFTSSWLEYWFYP